MGGRPEIPPEHLISPLDGRIVAASLPYHYLPQDRGWRSRVQEMMPTRLLYVPLTERYGGTAAEMEGWCVDG